MLRVRAGWMQWRNAIGFLRDKKIQLRLKGKFYRSVIRQLCYIVSSVGPTCP